MEERESHCLLIEDSDVTKKLVGLCAYARKIWSQARKRCG